MKNLTTETRRLGEDRDIGPSGDRVISHRIAGSLGSIFVMLRAVVREIFDESAYERFLARRQSERSVASYRQFLRERETTMSRKPRCC